MVNMKAFTEDYDAYFDGEDETSNPYSPDSDDYLDWNDGYSESEIDYCMMDGDD
jgi:hypothetical protein